MLNKDDKFVSQFFSTNEFEGGGGGRIPEEKQQTEVRSQEKEAISSTAPTAKIDKEKHHNCLVSVIGKLDQFLRLNKESWSSSSIFRVPRNLREMEPKAYTPQFISIGPLHRGDAHLQNMEVHKWRFFYRHLNRAGQDPGLYIEAISQLVDRTRRCYAWPTDDMDDQEFIEMILLDSCFILELLLAVDQGFRRDYDQLFASRAVILQIRCDMLLLENQIPLFVLDRLFAISTGPNYNGKSVSQLAFRFFNWTFPGSIKNQEIPNTATKDEEGLHLLHVIRQSLITLQSTEHTSISLPSSSSSSSRPLDEPVDSRHYPNLTMQCASMLRDSGVKFEKRTTSRLTDIEFKRGVLKIPPLLVDDATKSIFLNLMAFEQCHPQCSDQISSYIVFMDGLINSPRDVAYLQQKGIIYHQLGSEEAVAQLFNDLCREIGVNSMDGSLSILTSQLNAHISRKWPAWRASLKNEYFRHPWSTISVVAAVLIIGLTVTQTLYSILAYHVPHS